MLKAVGVKFDEEESAHNRMKIMKKTRNRNLELSGIIINKEKKPVAVINDIFVKEGDMIGEGKVSKITIDKVEIIFQDKTIILTIE
jgi:hypothetical protein